MSATVHETARIHRLTVAAYHRMGEVGILASDLRTELIEGEIVEMPPIGHTHGGTVNYLSNRLKESIGSAVIVAVQNPVQLSELSEPQPDIALLRPRTDYYRVAHPRPDDVLLVIEVAEKTLRYDRDVKLPLYAKAGIPEAWLVDLKAKTLTVCCDPSSTKYQEIVIIDDLTQVDVPVTPTRTIDLSPLFEGM